MITALGNDIQPINQGSSFSSLLCLARELPMLPGTWTTTFFPSSCKILPLPFGHCLLKADQIQQNILLLAPSRKEPCVIHASHRPRNDEVDEKKNGQPWSEFKPLTFGLLWWRSTNGAAVAPVMATAILLWQRDCEETWYVGAGLMKTICSPNQNSNLWPLCYHGDSLPMELL